ncbi:hypothetical protein ILUMI_13398 [Ignelater luminosus]|uniref:Uncharacterized protein n=1 Tax=Ignelater luminosus TaxID=2038154 RepID=A0A8K0CUK5_IGNLU|nr:hypothetical protein ILUMI_13398 [Ignelater luminosus]
MGTRKVATQFNALKATLDRRLIKYRAGARDDGACKDTLKSRPKLMAQHQLPYKSGEPYFWAKNSRPTQLAFQFAEQNNISHQRKTGVTDPD